jgi:hypothetical protein
VQRRAEVGRNV